MILKSLKQKGSLTRRPRKRQRRTNAKKKRRSRSSKNKKLTASKLMHKYSQKLPTFFPTSLLPMINDN